MSRVIPKKTKCENNAALYVLYPNKYAFYSHILISYFSKYIIDTMLLISLVLSLSLILASTIAAQDLLLLQKIMKDASQSSSLCNYK